MASLWALLNKVEHGVYFDSVSMFIFLLLGGRYLESMARRKTGEATEKLVKLIPAFAHAVPGWPQDQTQQEVAVSQLAVGDVVLVKARRNHPLRRRHSGRPQQRGRSPTDGRKHTGQPNRRVIV